MGSFESGVANDVLLDAAEQAITANMDLDWAKVENHEDLERIAQDIEVETYAHQRRIAESLHSIETIFSRQDRIRKVMASVDGDAFEKKYAEMKEMNDNLEMVKSSLKSYLKSVFGSVIDPLLAIRSFQAAKKDLLRYAEEMADAIPGYEMVKANDVGRNVTSPTMGKGSIVHVDPDKVMIAWESGQEQWVTQDELATADVKMEDESGTAVTAEGDGDTAAAAVQGPSDSPDGTIGMEDRERNPLMDYLQGFELDEEKQDGMKKAPVSRPQPSKMTMSAGVSQPDDKPGATKSNPQEPETINPTPKKIKYRLEALDETTKTWKEIGVYDSAEKANEKADEMKAELPMTMETQVTPLVGIDKDGKPDYQTTPKGPEGDNTEQTVKEVKAAGAHQAWDVFLNGKNIDTVFYTPAPDVDADYVKRSLVNHDGYDPNIEVRKGRDIKKKSSEDDVNEGKEGARWCVTCDQWIPADALLAKNGCPHCWSPTMTKEEKMETESSQKKTAAGVCESCGGKLDDEGVCVDCHYDKNATEEQYNFEVGKSLEKPKREAVAPEGWEGTVKKLKKHKDKVDNPWALAWWMKGEGYKPGGKKKSSLSYRQGAWELWLSDDKESPIVSQDPAVVAYVTANKLNWSLKKATAAMRYVKDLDVSFIIY